VPGTTEVVDALLFGAGNRATVETQEFLADIGRRFREDVKSGQRFSSFAPDAELFLVLVNLRDAQGEARRKLLQVPTAFTISNDEVTSLIAAGRSVLRASNEFQALNRSMGLPAAP
jgi:NTE family protein